MANQEQKARLVAKHYINYNGEKSARNQANYCLQHMLCVEFHTVKCAVCGKMTNRYFWWENATCCDDCSCAAANMILEYLNDNHFVIRQRSAGTRYGFKLASTEMCKESLKWLNGIICLAKATDKNVFFLGRDMDAFYLCFAAEPHVKYLSGWDRGFTYNATEKDKLSLIGFHNVTENDFVVDTGFYGSILDDMTHYVSIKGFLLSSSTHKYECLHRGLDSGYRDWVLEIENIRRSRRVDFGGSSLPIETYTQDSDFYFEQGFFQGFRKGAEKIMVA